jgi:hypothetical protein
MLWDPTDDPQEDQPRDVIGIKVFKESEVWANHGCWWMVPSNILQGLYLGTWETEEFPTDHQLEYIRGQYRESVVLVY